jgi:transcriptional regulator with XRE-family HTH domain
MSKKARPNLDLAKTLRARRDAKGLRADFVARQMGISKAYLSRLEKGERHWSLYLLERFGLAVGDGLPAGRQGNHKPTEKIKG